MTTADKNPIPNRGTKPQHPLAASQQCDEKGAPPLTLAAIGRALHTTCVARDAADHAAVTAEKDSTEQRLQRTVMGVLDNREAALCALAMTMRPTNMQDAAVQIGAAIDAANDLSTFDLSKSDADNRADAILRTLLGVFPIVVQAAGLKMEAFSWASFESLEGNLAGMEA